VPLFKFPPQENFFRAIHTRLAAIVASVAECIRLTTFLLFPAREAKARVVKGSLSLSDCRDKFGVGYFHRGGVLY
jgi:hypothetical protein